MIYDPEPRNQYIGEKTLEGWSARKIADRLGVSPRTVQRVRFQLGIAQTQAPHFTPDEIEKAELMLSEGYSLAALARALGRNEPTIYQRFRGRGWSPEKSATFNKRRHQLRGGGDWSLGYATS